MVNLQRFRTGKNVVFTICNLKSCIKKHNDDTNRIVNTTYWQHINIFEFLRYWTGAVKLFITH